MLAQIETESLPLNYHFLCIQEKKTRKFLLTVIMNIVLEELAIAIQPKTS